MEVGYLLVGLILGGGIIYFLKSGEITRLLAQQKILTDLNNARIGYRVPSEPVPDKPSDPETVEYWTDRVKTLTTALTVADEGVPDLLARQETARALTEARTELTIRAEQEMARNSDLPFHVN